MQPGPRTHDRPASTLVLVACGIAAAAVVLALFGLAASRSYVVHEAPPSDRPTVAPASVDTLDGVGQQSISLRIGENGFEPSRIAVDADVPLVLEAVATDGRRHGLRFERDGAESLVDARGTSVRFGALDPGVYPFVDRTTGARGSLVVR